MALWLTKAEFPGRTPPPACVMDSKTALRRLRELLDADTYASVMAMLAGTTVYFPSSMDGSDREERNLQIKEDFYSGKYEITESASINFP